MRVGKVLMDTRVDMAGQGEEAAQAGPGQVKEPHAGKLMSDSIRPRG